MRRLRGRPRHNDVLTPREWEVLSLLREGLTNEQIAERLGVSFDTAKFHVSEILTKLGVETRQEAAAWRGQPRAVPAPATAPTIWQRAGLTTPVRVIAATAVATVAVGLLALAGGLLLMSSRNAEGPAATKVEARTGDEALDILIDAVLTADAPALANRFAGVTAREGVVVGGPVGLYQPATIPTAEWTARLANSSRTLYAVVRDPVEPFPWNQSPAPPMPRAAIYAGPRDYDVLLLVTEPGFGEMAWRVSADDGRIVDLIIDNVPATAPPAYPQATNQLLLRVRDLMPSPDNARASFVIFPRENMLPPPVQPGAAGSRQPSGVANPPHAPSGRTGIADVDGVIDALVSDSAAALLRAYTTVPATHEDCVPSGPPGACSQENRRAPAEEWIERLVAGRQGLHAVTTSQAGLIDVFIAVDGGDYAFESWRFTLNGSHITALRIVPPIPASILDPSFLAQGLDQEIKWSRVQEQTPSVTTNFEQFFVLPPRDTLPSRPKTHPLTVRTGIRGVDGLFGAIDRREPQVIGNAAVDMDVVVRDCDLGSTIEDGSWVQAWARETVPKIFGIHAVAHVPEGYPTDAEHMIFVDIEINPYRWMSAAILEKEGGIVGLITSASGSCNASRMYPPTGYLVAPPRDTTPFDTTRRSGVAIVDAALDAASNGDDAAMANLISYSPTQCGYKYAPPCPQGAPPGTIVQALPGGACHGGYTLPEDAPKSFVDGLSTKMLYAVVQLEGPERNAPQPPGWEEPLWKVVMVSSEGDASALFFGSTGILNTHRNCGPGDPTWLLTGNPNFLLSPP